MAARFQDTYTQQQQAAQEYMNQMMLHTGITLGNISSQNQVAASLLPNTAVPYGFNQPQPAPTPLSSKQLNMKMLNNN
jgi:hypothetical protein